MIENLIPKMYRHIRRKVFRNPNGYESSRIINRIISRSHDKNDRIALMDFKISVLREFGELCDIKESVYEIISESPFSPETWIHLIIFFRDDVGDGNNAINACDISIAISLMDGNFIIQCLTEKVRTAIHFGDVRLAVETIERLIIHRRKPNSLDEIYQLDFLNHPNASLIPADVSNRYIAHVKAHRNSY